MIADSWIEMEQFRLFVMRTAWRIDKYQDYKRVRADISAVKAAMPKVLANVAQRALQVHGSLGVTNEMPFMAMLMNAMVMGLGDGPTEVSTLSIDETLAAWVERNDCRPPTPQRTELPDVEPDGTTVARESWSGCDRGELTFYEIMGGGHTWPGSPVDFNDFLGPESHDMAASEVIVDFFLSHGQ